MAKGRKYWWFQGDSVAELTRQLVAAGDFARLEVHPAGKGLLLYVIPAGAVRATDGTGGINESHVCPPICP